jgi:hypothetical protein
MTCECGDRCDLEVIELEMLNMGFIWTNVCLTCEFTERLYVKVNWEKVETWT